MQHVVRDERVLCVLTPAELVVARIAVSDALGRPTPEFSLLDRFAAPELAELGDLLAGLGGDPVPVVLSSAQSRLLQGALGLRRRRLLEAVQAQVAETESLDGMLTQLTSARTGAARRYAG